jgi:DegV family protein with EDD domain
MRIATTAGSNLSDALAQELEITVMPQSIVVDGVAHESREASLDQALVDAWIRKGRAHPTAEAPEPRDFLRYFGVLAQRDPEILAVLTSRKLLGAHDAALTAKTQLAKSTEPALKAARIEVVDTEAMDVGAGLLVQAAAQARNAGLGLEDAARFLRALASRMENLLFVNMLDQLIRSGRANFLESWVTGFLDVRPMLSLVEGELRAVGKRRAKADLGAKLGEYFAEKFAPGTSVWAAVAHGAAPELATQVAERLSRAYRVEYLCVRPFCPSVYLHTGPRSVAAFVLPLEGFAYRLRPPRST